MKTVLALIIALNITPAFAGISFSNVDDMCGNLNCPFPTFPNSVQIYQPSTKPY